MSMMLRPLRGGFLQPFGCGWFIREFLLEHSPEGSLSSMNDRGEVKDKSNDNSS